MFFTQFQRVIGVFALELSHGPGGEYLQNRKRLLAENSGLGVDHNQVP